MELFFVGGRNLPFYERKQRIGPDSAEFKFRKRIHKTTEFIKKKKKTRKII